MGAEVLGDEGLSFLLVSPISCVSSVENRTVYSEAVLILPWLPYSTVAAHTAGEGENTNGASACYYR